MYIINNGSYFLLKIANICIFYVYYSILLKLKKNKRHYYKKNKIYNNLFYKKFKGVMKNMKKIREFQCPSCGNPLTESENARMRCPYCRTIIVPKSSRLRREEKIYVKYE